MNTWRTFIVGLLIVALPLSATASFAAGLSCPHQGLGAAVHAHHGHDHAAMSAAHHPGAPASVHHACDCVHHCAGVSQAFAPSLAFDAAIGATAAPARYRSFHTDSSEPPLLRPPISAPVS